MLQKCVCTFSVEPQIVGLLVIKIEQLESRK